MFNFNNSYTRLPPHFYAKSNVSIGKDASLIKFNTDLAKYLDIDFENKNDYEIVKIFTDEQSGSSQIALAYAGHQFGHFVNQLGDGRALLMGEVVNSKNERFDIQLKGSGRTPFSRNGDGKSSLGPVIREYIVSEAMHALGIPTTRALAAMATGETVRREDDLPGGLFVRVASSHIRIGTFEYFAARQDLEALELLTKYAINRHYPHIKDAKNVYLAFIEEVAKAQSELIAKWMSVGFIHGVMNTDNMSISGETLDYGPCAFMDNFSRDKVFSSIDRNSRYAYDNQMPMAQWNLFKLASCLLPLIDGDQEYAQKITQQSLESYMHIYDDEWLKSMAKKLGIEKAQDSDKELINDFLNILEENKLDFTVSFRDLTEGKFSDSGFVSKWKQTLSNKGINTSDAAELMNKVNPIYIPRNHQVQLVIDDALNGNYQRFEKMNEVLKSPFKTVSESEEFTRPPKENEVITATYCGT